MGIIYSSLFLKWGGFWRQIWVQLVKISTFIRNFYQSNILQPVKSFLLEIFNSGNFIPCAFTLYTVKGKGNHQRSGHIETGIRKYVHLSSSSPYSTVQMLPPRDSQPLPSFMAILVCKIELLLPAIEQLLPPPTSFSLPVRAQWWDEQEGIAAFIITAVKAFKEMQECHSSDTPLLLC